MHALNSFGVAACALTVSVASALAESATPWSPDLRSSARIVAALPGVDAGNKILRAGVEFKLEPGWRVLWRASNEAILPAPLDLPDPDSRTLALPLQFDFAASENIKSVQVLWPKPDRFFSGGEYVFGYQNNVLLPLHVAPQDSNMPAVLRLKVDYAVCKEICLPAKGRLELRLSDNGAEYDTAVSEAEARVPKTAQ